MIKLEEFRRTNVIRKLGNIIKVFYRFSLNISCKLHIYKLLSNTFSSKEKREYNLTLIEEDEEHKKESGVYA